MEIRKSNINFGARILYPMKLKKMEGNTCKLIKADFAELSTDSVKDKNFIYNLTEAWKTTNRANNYINQIKESFQEDALSFEKKFKFFITKFSSRKRKMVDRTATVAVVYPDNPGLLQLKFLQSAPDKSQKIKGGGACTLLGVVKYAKDKGFQQVELVSVDDKFYEHMGFSKFPSGGIEKDTDAPSHFLTCDKFTDFIKSVSEKYGIS